MPLQMTGIFHHRVRKLFSILFKPCISINHAEVQGRRDLRSFDTSQEVSGGKCMCSHVVAQTPPRPLAIFNGTIPGIILFAHQQFHLFLLLNAGVGSVSYTHLTLPTKA